MPSILDERGAEVLSYRNLYDLYQSLHEKAQGRTFLISSEELLDNPLVNVKWFCKHAGIPFSPEQLHWNKLEPRYEGEVGNGVWQLSEHCIFSQHWQDSALRSTCFDRSLLNPIKTDANGETTFEEIPENHRLAYTNLYKEQYLYYQLLMKEYENSIKIEPQTLAFNYS